MNEDSLSANAAPTTSAQYVLKAQDAFLVTNRLGDITGAADGLFIDDTRMLSCFRMRLSDTYPKLLSAGVDQENIYLTSHLTNPSQWVDLTGRHVDQGAVYLERRYLLLNSRLYVRLQINNFCTHTLRLAISFDFAADFKDMFEIRGQTRKVRGQALPTQTGPNAVHLHYLGLDEIQRTTVISFSENPHELTPDHAQFSIELAGKSDWEMFCEIGAQCEYPTKERFEHMSRLARNEMQGKLSRGAQIVCDGRLVQSWLDKARADLALLTSDLDTGPYPYAGIPWFSTPFGRDAIITALQTMWLNPNLARGVLNYLAQHQALETSDFHDSQPGKILHETRRGEMAQTREIPFIRYYGGVDTTPLFIVLAGEYYTRTADQAFITHIWPQLKAATHWIDQRISHNSLGLLDYQRGEQTGLANQGWKDSFDSISHADASLAEGPIALVEVQGYVFKAYKELAKLAEVLGDQSLNHHCQQKAEHIRHAVESYFWLPQLKSYALALDGQHRPCQVVASNMGHLLYCGLPNQERAKSVIQQLMQADMHSGWGIRTLSKSAARFNPMSYHNGSVWPHDVALCSAGMARFGEQQATNILWQEMFEAALYFQMRLPELFCGFSRTTGESPVAYPVACQPQSWASGAAFMLLQACLGLEIDAPHRLIRVNQPTLPESINTLQINQLIVQNKSIGLRFTRQNSQTLVHLTTGSDRAISLQVNYN
ncbi:amylo-alpha-1,6-glucosidase [Celerinatantimonas diazotrophica]|uniref:Glycogen debranching enzyme n=1 Tax=Celerinatantimonas diazotrophica TaxID=412034 RepID=A0A4R1K2B1_9GAMM|nr:amylo-alpha-1,6-glucosidase [Celerinatantimonas diazotrophica]TCK58122.1 glycogen debranching enzyme [Celerinatantimonas diazotrophica]CAG9297806.1 hypothetical protein CEDIAZO_02997 [Celerinatantimonas diazotrophica]